MKKKIKVLSKKDVKKLENRFPEWKLDSKATKCTRTFTFDKHIDALIFIARTTVNSEILNHYPEITFTHLKVKMVITTHDIKGITHDDVLLLARVEHVYSSQKVDKR